MTRTPRSHSAQFWRPAEAYFRVAWVVLLIAFGFSVALLAMSKQLSPGWKSLEGVFVLFAGLMGLWIMARRLPMQNVVAAGLIIMGLSALAVATFAYYGTSKETGVGFHDSFGPSLLNSNNKRLLPWLVPFLVLALCINSRETTRMLLRPWRREKNYGWWLLSVSAVLVVLASLTVEPFAMHVAKWWRWSGEISPSSWEGIPWTALIVWYVLALAVLWFAGPWFVVKRPLPVIPDLSPVCVWLLLLLYFTIGNALHSLWLAVGAGVVVSAVVGLLAFRGWRRSQPPVTPGQAPASSNAAA